MVMDHLHQAKGMVMRQIQDMHLMANLQHLVTTLHQRKAILRRLQDQEGHHKDILKDSMVLLAVIIHHHLLNTIKDMVRLLAAMVNIGLHLAQAIKCHPTPDRARPLVGLQLLDLASIQVMIRIEDIHHIRKEGRHLEQVLQVLYHPHNSLNLIDRKNNYFYRT